MKPIGTHNYFVYILTNKAKTVLYIGVTNDLHRRLREHSLNSQGKKSSFASRNNCIYLLYYERFGYIEHAINRETQLKKWSRIKKENLIKTMNPGFDFLNDTI